MVISQTRVSVEWLFNEINLFQFRIVEITSEDRHKQPPDVFCKSKQICNFIKKETLPQVLRFLWILRNF